MTYLLLFLEFFKIGLFAIGGGLATLPFLYELARNYSWFDEAMLANMIAISQSTPGPIGINMATYAGFNAAGILGGVIATVGLVTPSVIIIIIVAHILNKFKQSHAVQAVFYALRPAVTGLIAVAGFAVFKISVLSIDQFEKTKDFFDLFNYKALILFIFLFYITNKINKHPIVYIAGGAIIGILITL